MSGSKERHALVIGSTGFIGRHVILALDAAGIATTAGTRSDASYRQLTSWLKNHGCATPPAQLRLDFDAARLGVSDPTALENVSEIYNCAGAYRFGMTVNQARHANVDSAREIVALAAGVPGLSRLVHVSGYRVGGQDPALVPWNPHRTRDAYTKLGAYEASKAEADAVVQSESDRRGVRWSIVNPASASGVSHSGETTQWLGLAASLKELWQGGLAALPGNDLTFVPVVPVDYLARFMTALPVDATTAGGAYWVLDEATPALPELLRLVGRHYRVKTPRARIPIALVKRLPSRVTKTDRETLTFLSQDRYPTGSAVEVAERHGLHMPDTIPSLLRWADHLAAHRFGDTVDTESARGFSDYAGVRTFAIGSATSGTLVLPGLPVNADTWSPVATAIGGATVLDLPGLGMSYGTTEDWPQWLADLLDSTAPTHLIGHSIGAAAAIEAATLRPDRIDRLTLIAPFFLQDPSGASALPAPLARFYLRRVGPKALSRRLTGSQAHARALVSSVSDLRRGSTAARVTDLLKRAGNRQWRRHLLDGLSRFSGTVHVIVGDRDPLAEWASSELATLGPRLTISSLTAAGHHPQLTHPQDLAAAITAARTPGDRQLSRRRRALEDVLRERTGPPPDHWPPGGSAADG